MASSSNATLPTNLATPTSLDDLTEDLKLNIASRVAALSLKDFQSLLCASPSFYRLSDDRSILSNASLDISMLRWNKFPWNAHNPNPNFHAHYDKYETFLLRCVQFGNPEALTTLFNVGHRLFFECSPFYDDNRHQRGLQNIAQASANGISEATEWYGLILISLGGDNVQMGFDILRPYNIRLTPPEVLEMEDRWDRRARKFEWRLRYSDAPFYFRVTYDRQECDCAGLTERWFTTPAFAWERFQEFNGMPTSQACEICLWHVIITRLFRLEADN